MSHRAKRRLNDFEIANASDPEDGDWDAPSSPKPHRRSKPSGKRNRPKKKTRGGYDDSEDDIVDDNDDISEGSFGEGTEIDSEDEVELNPRTGRPSRSAAKKAVKYEEESDDEIESTIESDGSDIKSLSRNKRQQLSQQKKPSLIIKLPVGQNSSSRLRGTRSGRRQPTPQMGITRRSSRLSHEPQEPLIELTNSGKHTQVAREGTVTPEAMPQGRRASKASKGLVGGKRPPSAIMEASQEVSAQSMELGEETQVGNDSIDPAEDPIGQLLEASKTEAEDIGNGSEAGSAAQDTQLEAEEGVIAESVHEEEAEGDDSDDEGPVTRGGRSLRSRAQQKSASQSKSSSKRRRGDGESSDFEPVVDEEKEGDVSESDEEPNPKRRRQSTTEESSGDRRSKRIRTLSQKKRDSDSEADELDRDELAEEAEELAEDNSRRRRSARRPQPSTIAYDEAPRLRNRGAKPDYRVFRPELVDVLNKEDDDDPMPTATPSRNRRAGAGGGGGGGYRNLFSLAGPFGGGGQAPLFGEGAMTTGNVDSDSSDDDMVQRAPKIGGAAGMTPTSASMPGLFPQTHNTDPLAAGGASGGPAGLGKVKDKKALADADPLGVAQDITFDAVGGLSDHINKLKEMVMLPLLYPEVFKQFNATPPRGVLFHGPPGTGKTLLARALASSVSSSGQKVTFYMRKGADALSKWVGEAERQLRLLFEEARKNQPSIIFFDEIDGLAPVRSSKQEQIHASIVATLLALMDGMDGRGQVIVIGATNRPDSVDPALRRPGRFDREFYFPLPDIHARRAIIDIHTKGWEPPLPVTFKDHLSEITNGYGGADLRALCAEAALNAIQGTFPQIYKSEKKLIIDPSEIKVLAKDFMISVNKMIPSSERAGHSRGKPLSKKIDPLLRQPLADITKILDNIMPKKKKTTALEEAEYDDREADGGFEKEMMAREFERSRVFRPRLLVRGLHGMGQGYLGEALLHKFEDLFVQSFDIATLLEESSRSPEAAVVQLFKEVRRHKPSVIFIPNVDIWYETVQPSVIRTFTGLLNSLRPDEPVLVLGIMETSSENDRTDPNMLRDLFGFSLKNQYEIQRPGEADRRVYFEDVIKFIRMEPTEFPDDENREKRKFKELPLAPEAKPEGPTKEQIKAQKKADRITLNNLKVMIQPVMDQIKRTYRKFRTPIIDPAFIQYLFDEQDPNNVSSDLPPEMRQHPELYRPYELSRDEKGEPGLREVTTGKFYYNLEIVMIEKRLSNGYYKRPRDFLADIKRLAKDAKTSGDEERTLKANELVANVEVDMHTIERNHSDLVRECENVFAREKAREQEAIAKAEKAAAEAKVGNVLAINMPLVSATITTDATGPIQLGEKVPDHPSVPPITPLRHLNQITNGDAAHIDESPQALSNGSHVSPQGNDDAAMTDAPPDSHLISSAAHTQPRSQRTAYTYLHPGSAPADYHNSASTTTSGQKTSEKSNRSSGGYNHTQSTNGVVSYPDFNTMQPGGSAGSQSIPDTQELSQHYEPSQASQQAPQHQMGPPLPKPHNSNISSLLNAELTLSSKPTIILDEAQLAALHVELTRRSSGLSVEQLEQINAYLMDTIWKERNVWNRAHVALNVGTAFNEVMSDIEAVQSLLLPSQKSQVSRYGHDEDGR